MSANTIIPLYSTRGDAEAFLLYPHLYNRGGEWVGFITPEKEIYSVLGYHVGSLAAGPRIFRRRSAEEKPRLRPPAAPPKIRVPNHIPLPRLMGDVPFEMVDVLQEEPERLHTLDSGEMRQDLD